MLFNFIFEQPPVLFSLAANIEREREIVVVFVVRRPENAPGTTLLEALRRRLGLRRPRKFRRCCSRARIVWIVCLRQSKLDRCRRRRSPGGRGESLHADTRILDYDAVDHWRGILRQIRETHPRNPRRRSAIGLEEDRLPLDEA